MSTSELLLTVVVALVVFGPKKLPMLARHLGQLIAKGHHYQQQALAIWQSHLNKQRLQENRNRAQEADASYPQGSGADDSSERK
ncbi:MAG TPA: preprotein translocase subunit TatB [Legionella sp.]|nr:preprotein translocase subunit TatB [Legionella sp.]